MTERYGAAVHVDARRIDSELAHHRDGLNGERFVDLEQVDVIELPSDLRGDLPHRFDGCHEHELRREPAGGLADDARHRRHAERARLLR